MDLRHRRRCRRLIYPLQSLIVRRSTVRPLGGPLRHGFATTFLGFGLGSEHRRRRCGRRSAGHLRFRDDRRNNGSWRCLRYLLHHCSWWWRRRRLRHNRYHRFNNRRHRLHRHDDLFRRSDLLRLLLLRDDEGRNGEVISRRLGHRRCRYGRWWRWRRCWNDCWSRLGDRFGRNDHKLLLGLLQLRRRRRGRLWWRLLLLLRWFRSDLRLWLLNRLDD